MHLAGAGTLVGAGVDLVLDTSFSASRNASKHDESMKDGLEKADKLRFVIGDARSPVHFINTSTPLRAEIVSPVRNTSFSDSGDDTEPYGSVQADSDEEDKISFAGNVSINISDVQNVKEEEKKTMKMLTNYLVQTRAFDRTYGAESDKLSRKCPKTVDAELKEKMTFERIRALQHEEKLMNERKLQKEKEIEMFEAEARLIQLKEKREVVLKKH